jgi:hypothetical protein
MSNGNGYHKTKSYHFPTPLVIRCNSKLTVMAGKATLTHEGDLLIRIVNDQMLELKPLDRIETEPDSMQTVLVDGSKEKIPYFTIPKDYTLFFKTEASRTSYGTAIGVYEYYKREKDAAYIMAIKKGNEIKHLYDLGSLFDQSSKITVALKTFTREKPFYRRDLKPRLMPPSLKQGQLIKGCLEILVKEGFLGVQNVSVGEQQIDRFTRTLKMLP